MVTKIINLAVLFSFSLFAIAQSRTNPPGHFPDKVHTSKGAMSFHFNNHLYTANPVHAKGYAMKQTGYGFINAASSDEGFLVGIELFVKGKGGYSIKRDEDGKINFTINNVMYWVRMPGDYLNVEITGVRQAGPLLLLDGTFEGVVEDKEGNKAKVTDGKFSTISL